MSLADVKIWLCIKVLCLQDAPRRGAFAAHDIHGNSMHGRFRITDSPTVLLCNCTLSAWLQMPALQLHDLHAATVGGTGDAGAAMMLTTIQAKPGILRMCLTRYMSRSLMVQLTEQLAANLKLHKPAGRKGSKAKKAVK